MSDALKNSPSLAAWLALAVLAVALAINALTGSVFDPATAPEERSPPATALAGHMERAIQAASVIGLTAPAAVLLLGGPWQAFVWWFVFPTLAIAVVNPLFGMVVALVACRSELRVDAAPADRRRINIASAMIVASALVIPVGIVALRAIGGAVTTAATISLLVGLLGWQVARRWYQRAEQA